MTQAEAAAVVGVARRTWQDWEYDITPFPAYAVLSIERWELLEGAA